MPSLKTLKTIAVLLALGSVVVTSPGYAAQQQLAVEPAQQATNLRGLAAAEQPHEPDAHRRLGWCFMPKPPFLNRCNWV